MDGNAFLYYFDERSFQKNYAMSRRHLRKAGAYLACPPQEKVGQRCVDDTAAKTGRSIISKIALLLK